MTYYKDLEKQANENDKLHAEIQQLKDQLKDVTAVELKLGELQGKIEAAKKIFKEQLLSDIITEKDYIEIMQILAGETTK